MEASKPTVHFRFERIEKKFWMSAEQYQSLLPILQERLSSDAYGESLVCNIYYDTKDHVLIRRSVERPLFKEKLRLRSYGIPGETDPVFVEIKRKLNGIGYKRRVSLPFAQAKELLRGKEVDCAQPQIAKEILSFVQRYRPTAQVVLTYRRCAWTDPEDPQFRLTLDRQIRYRLDDPEHPGEEGMLEVMDDPSRVLMEIKSMGGIPLWLVKAMSGLKITQAPFSKIGTCYTQHMAEMFANEESKKG